MQTAAPPAPDSNEKVTELQAQFDTPIDAARLRRFLRARDGNVQAAASLLKADIAWRASRPVPPPPASFAERLPQRKSYFHLADKGGMPLIIVVPGRHRNTEPVEVRIPAAELTDAVQENICYAIYMFELAIQSCAPGVERIMILIDFEGFGMHCLDYGFLKQAIAVLQNNYPERLGRVCLLDPPFVFRAAWAVIRPWLDEKTRQKVLFLSGDYQKELLKMVDASSLPVKYGGTSAYEYDPVKDTANLYGLLPAGSPPPPTGPAPASPSPSAPSDPPSSPTPSPAATTTEPSAETKEAKQP